MLSIGKLGAGQHSYYLGKVAEGAEDYYSGEAEAEGYWLGDGAEDLGLQGKVTPGQLVSMLGGEDPASGLPLGLKSAPGREPVPGFDLTFSAPKSVSLTWALGGHPVAGQVTEAHRAAVAEALSYLQREACWARRGRGGQHFVKGNGFIAAAYAHRSSRAGDPQLHTHVLIANATRGPDGRHSRLYHPALFEHAKTASYIYEAHLRHELTQRLGAEWLPVRKGIADLLGFKRAQLERFSTRRAEIVAAAGEGASARAMQIATLETRRAKERDVSAESLREVWREKGEEVGLRREEIERRLGRQRPGKTLLTAEAVGRTATAHVSHFDRREAIQAVAENLPHGAPASEVEGLADDFLASAEVIRISEGPKGERFTTTRIWELERQALESASRMAGERSEAAVHEIAVSRLLESRPSLGEGQREMVRRLLSAERRLEVVIGEAGTGKTHATVAAAEGWGHGRCKLKAVAPTWRAAGALRAEGLEATSLAQLLARLDGEGARRELDRSSVLLVDEAGMVDSQTLGRLIDHADRAGAKLVLVGDPAQLGEIEAGGLFRSIAERAECVRLGEVIRHNHDLDREGSKLIREGRGAEAIARYEQGGRVVLSPDAAERREAMVCDWWAARQRGEEALMVVGPNCERRQLNELAREVMAAEGRLGAEEVWVGGRPFSVGDEVITRVNDQRAQIFNRERWRVEAVEPESGRMRLAGIDAPRQVGVDPGYLERSNPYDGAPAIEHGYAATIYQAQGATVDTAFVAVDPAMDRQQLYVATSRSREETYLYATRELRPERLESAPGETVRNGLDHIARAAERDGSQASAHDAALRARLGELTSPDLHTRRAELSSQARSEERNDRAHKDHAERIADAEGRLDRVREGLRDLGPKPSRLSRRAVRQDYARKQSSLVMHGENLLGTIADAEEGREALPAVAHDARSEVAVIEHLLAERLRERLVTVRLDPPHYLVAELGERPAEGSERNSWDRGVGVIERFRQKHGIADPERAFGHEPDKRELHGGERSRAEGPGYSECRAARSMLEKQQRELSQVKDRVIDRTIGISREIGL